MKITYPKKLTKGDTIMVICPSRSLSVVNTNIIKIALDRFEKIGIKVIFGKNVFKKNEFNSSSINDRIEDINIAFKNKEIKGIFAGIGGYNSNQLLNYINWDLIRNNPKIFCGFSDITILLNAIYQKTGVVTYLGPNFSSFGQKLYFDYTFDYFIKSCFQNTPYVINSSQSWSDDNWKKNQHNRKQIKNIGPLIINQGLAQGRLFGGNLCSFNLLQGTQYLPKIDNLILCLEDDGLTKESSIFEFDRNIQSLLQQENFKIKGLLIGRFQKNSNVRLPLLYKLIKNISILNKIPVIANLDFGHTDPKITLPIGGIIAIKATNNKAQILIKKY